VAGGATVLLTTQYLEEADQLADDIVLIDHGVVAARGTPGELKARAGDRRLEVRPERGAEKAELILAEVTGLTPHRGEDGLLSVPLRDPAVTLAVFRRLEGAGIPLAEHAVRRPTLDEAFLALTDTTTSGRTR
jgi:oleandomycin transport system ATP-binding protein